MAKLFIIAEAGVNHNGSLSIAKRLVDVASDSGADAVKFQTFKADKLVCEDAPKASYQKKTTGGNETQFEMLKKLELSCLDHTKLLAYCKKRKIEFLSTPFDCESVDFLYKLGLRIFKIPSGEITNLPYLRKVGSLHKKIIMSTGMADLEEVRTALEVLVLSGTKKENITILHCNTEYPTRYEDVNLLAMITMRKALKVRTGYSDHTPGLEVPIAAVALGATVIEKHFTLDKRMQGPDHKASLEPNELKKMVLALRNTEKILGNGIKKPSSAELRNKPVSRKSIVALKNINKGEVFNECNIVVKRPGTGINPMRWDKILGTAAKRHFKKDRLIEV